MAKRPEPKKRQPARKKAPAALGTEGRKPEHALRAQVSALLDVWQTAATDPSSQNLEKLARSAAALEAQARRVRQYARALDHATRVAATSLAHIREDAPRQQPPAAPFAPDLALGELVEPAGEGPVSFDLRALPGAGSTERGAPTGPEMDLQKFFHDVSESVVGAQQQLDLRSIAYVQQLKDSPVPPSFYSIPKVTAAIKLGLTVKEGSGLFVKLFGSPEDKTNFSESTVSFDVVASAPPPGGPGMYRAPIPDFLVVGPERERVAAVVAGITAAGLPANAAEWLADAIIVRAGWPGLPEASRREYMLIHRGAELGAPVVVVRLNADKPKEAKIVKPADADTKLLLFDLVARIRDWESSVTIPPIKS